MLSKKLYINIIIRTIPVVLLSLLLGFMIFKAESVRLSIICSILLIITTFNLILYLNRTNRNIKFFFDSVRNDDSSLSFSLENKSGNIQELHRSMNQVNQQIGHLKIENMRQEQFFQKILELLATGIITYDSKGFIHHANSSAKRLLSAENLTHISQVERIDRRLFSIITAINSDEKHLVTANTKEGVKNLLLKSAASGSGDDRLTILSLQDIKNELDEKEIDAWMKLIRVLMHEIMNSITPITSLSESLQKIYRTDAGPIRPEKVTSKDLEFTLRGLEAIREQGKGLMHFVESYRKLSHITKPDIKAFRVSYLFNRVAILAESLENRGKSQILFTIQSSDYTIYADIDQISQVLINLIKNALEANEKNPAGVIKVSSVITHKNNPEILVTDNGPGILKENLENIFVPFFTTREKGSGIGLSLSRQIIAMHGGSLTVVSNPGIETLFRLRFRNES